jgi:hypothetical protein
MKLAPVLKHTDLMNVALWGLGITASIAAVAFTALAVATSEIWGPILAIGLAVAGAAFYLKKFYDYAKSIHWSEIGESIVHGIADGIFNGIPRMIAAMKHVGKSAWEAFRGFMEINSPAKKMMPEGASVVEGIAKGAEEEGRKGTVSAAINAASYNPAAFRKPSSTSSASSAPTTTNNTPVHAEFHFHGTLDKATAMEIVEEGTAILMEKLALMQGCAP